ncbi:MAG: metallophosphoesterase [Ruminiclostridium sp.]|nr:metallophosphoesterase [Ruminiclostridium sp.]
MILITGDVHGDFTRFKDKKLKKLRKSDALIICGDFGLIWDGSRKEKSMLKRLGRRRYNILFVEGVHENFAELEKYETEEWCGGLTRKISGNLRQLIRGQVFEIAGKTVFAFGGGKADDSSDPLKMKYEVPSPDELSETDLRLSERGNKIDYVVSYEPPQTIAEFLGSEDSANKIGAYLEEKKENLSFKHWFFGKFHVNKRIPTRFTAVFDSVINSEETERII